MWHLLMVWRAFLFIFYSMEKLFVLAFGWFNAIVMLCEYALRCDIFVYFVFYDTHYVEYIMFGEEMLNRLFLFIRFLRPPPNSPSRIRTHSHSGCMNFVRDFSRVDQTAMIKEHK